LIIIVIILILITLYLLYIKSDTIFNKNNNILYNENENFAYDKEKFTGLPVPEPRFKFDPNNLSNVIFNNNPNIGPIKKLDNNNGYPYIEFNGNTNTINNLYAVTNNPIKKADNTALVNTDITIECIFQYTGGTGTILSGLGSPEINSGWHQSYIEVYPYNGSNCLLLGMTHMHQDKTKIIFPLIMNTWYQVILKGSLTRVSAVLNSITQSNITPITSSFFEPSSGIVSPSSYHLGIGAKDSTSLIGGYPIPNPSPVFIDPSSAAIFSWNSPLYSDFATSFVTSFGLVYDRLIL
jgi:hypothetical protein